MNQPLSTPGLQGALRAHHAQFEALYRDNHAFVWRCARRMGVPASELEDVLQDVFVIAYRRLDRLDPQVKASTWLFGILRNVLRNRRRSDQRQQRRREAFAAQQRVEAGRQMQREHDRAQGALAEGALASFLDELPAAQREVFMLTELEGYSGREIAELLGIKVNTAHSRLRLARKAFVRRFELEPRREAVAAAVEPLRRAPEGPSPEVQRHSYGLILAAAAASPWRAGSGGGVFAWLSSKVGLAFAGAGVVASVALVGTLSAQAEGGALTHARESSRSRVPQANAEREGEGEASSPPASIEVFAPAQQPAASPPDAGERARVVVAAKHDDGAPTGEGEGAGAASAADTLSAARASLVAGEAARALELLDGISDEDPQLFDARTATRVAALCRLGRSQEARASVEALRERTPEATLLARIDGACW